MKTGKLVFNFKANLNEFYFLPYIMYQWKWKSIYVGFMQFELRIDW